MKRHVIRIRRTTSGLFVALVLALVLTPTSASAAPGFIDTTTADFSAGTTGSHTYVSETVNGEAILAPTEGSEFPGSSLPVGWSEHIWNPGGSATVIGGNLTIDGARAGTDATYGSGRNLEFEATFSNTPFAHIGFGVNYETGPWAMFSVKDDGSLHARTNNTGGTSDVQDTSLGSALLGSSHTYRIEWKADKVDYFVDDALVATHAISFAATEMRPLASDYNAAGGGLLIDWLRMSPYGDSTNKGTFTSRVFDAGGPVEWGALGWTANIPAGTAIVLSVRTGNAPTPDGSWSAFAPIVTSGDEIPGNSRYAQYRAELSSNDPDTTPALREVTLAFDQNPVAVDDSRTVDEDSGATTIDVLANDTDPDGGPKTIVSKTNGPHGTVMITNSGADLAYTPDPNYCNTDISGPGSGPDDSFTYTLNGGSTATVSVTVSCLPDVDTTPPDITIGEPDNRERYLLHDGSIPDFNCIDPPPAASGVASCTATPIDDENLGPHLFEVTAVDKAGNSSTKTSPTWSTRRTTATSSVTTIRSPTTA